MFDALVIVSNRLGENKTPLSCIYDNVLQLRSVYEIWARGHMEERHLGAKCVMRPSEFFNYFLIM